MSGRSGLPPGDALLAKTNVPAPRPAGSPKAARDRAQANFLIAALAELRLDELRLAHDEAVERGPGWRNRIEASLDRLPAARKHLLEAAGG